AEDLLAAASRVNRIGHFQLEAAIQSAHAERARSGTVDWSAVEHLYQGLIAFAPSIGARLGQAAATAELRGADPALRLIEDIPPAQVATHQPYWVLRADLLSRLGQTDAARRAYDHAFGLTEDASVRDFLMAKAKAT